MTAVVFQLSQAKPKMNPYAPPTASDPVTSISVVAIGILTTGIIGLGSIAAVLCGISCYCDIGGDSVDEVMAIISMYSVVLILFAFIGIPAGMSHLRQRSKLGQIPLAAYLVALTSLVLASLWGEPISRWFSIFLICYMMSIVVSIRSAVRYQHASDG